jgi:DNA topoisomerase-1
VVKEDRDGWTRSVRSLVLINDQIERRVETENTGAEKSKLFPTDIGMVVTDFLTTHFIDILDYNFTASVEKQFDEIALGHVRWNDMIREFYGPFEERLKLTSATAERQSGERELGVDPVSGKRVSVRLGRFGPLVQIGEADDEEKRQKGIPGTLSIATITLEQALELFKFPRAIGDFEGSTMEVKVGRFGPYIEHAGAFYSIPKTDDIHTIAADRGIEIILAKRQSIIDRTIKTFPEDSSVKILKGRWGAFIVVGKQNVRIPKGTDPASLTLEDCLALALQQEPKKPAAKKAAAKKTAAKKPAAKKATAKKAAKKPS